MFDRERPGDGFTAYELRFPDSHKAANQLQVEVHFLVGEVLVVLLDVGVVFARVFRETFEVGLEVIVRVD